MADYAISNVARRVVYAPSGVGPYAFTFEILTSSDIAVYRGSTLLTLTTDYTVTINANGTGSVTLVATAGTSNITIVGAKTIQRTTDFTTGGDFFANTINDELDAQTIFIQQVAETAERGLKAPVIDPTDINMTLPSKASRAGKTLAFDANGNPAVGEDIGNWRGDWAAGTSYTVRDLVRDASNQNVYRCNTAHTSTGTTPISSNADVAKWDIVIAVSDLNSLVDDAEAAQVAAEAAQAAAEAAQAAAETAETNAETAETNAETAATNASNSATAAAASAASALAALDSFDDRYLGAKTSDPALDNDGNALVAGALYFNSVDGVMKLYTGSAWIAAYVSGTASNVAFSPAGAISATNVQTAIQELDTEKVPRTSTTGSALVPSGTQAQRDGSPAAGYFRFNSDVAKFEGYNGTAWGSVGGGATGGGSDDIFIENGQTVTTNYTLTTGKNAGSFGPITINSGITVTVPSGQVWSII